MHIMPAVSMQEAAAQGGFQSKPCPTSNTTGRVRFERNAIAPIGEVRDFQMPTGSPPSSQQLPLVAVAAREELPNR